MEAIQSVLKDRGLNESQKILAIAMFMDPKQCPNSNIDPEIITLGYTVKNLIDENKIKLSFIKDGILNIDVIDKN